MQERESVRKSGAVGENASISAVETRVQQAAAFLNRVLVAQNAYFRFICISVSVILGPLSYVQQLCQIHTPVVYTIRGMIRATVQNHTPRKGCHVRVTAGP